MFVHGFVAFGDLIERECEVEDGAGVDGSGEDAVDKVGQEAPDRGGSAVEVDRGEEQLVAGQGDVV
jgi:hypothetical protein